MELTALKSFLIEKKNQKIFILAVAAVIVFIISISLLIFLVLKSQKAQKERLAKNNILPSPTIAIRQNNEEVIQSIGYSIDCQLVVNTSVKKIYVTKLDQCKDVLDYKISPSKTYAAYILVDKNKTSQLFIYSLDNNIGGQLQIISQPIVSYQFDSRNNLIILLNDKLVYYFIPLLLSGYPANYYKELNTFTDVDKRRIDVPFGDIKFVTAKIVEQNNGLVLTDSLGKTLFTIGFNDLDAELSPTPLPAVDRNKLQWDKRIFFYANNEFKTMDIDGSNVLSHQFICDGLEVIPINFRDSLMARSPDGQILAFLAPTEAQMRENPTWKEDIIAGKKVFTQGEIALYDFVKNTCQRSGVVQSLTYRETFAFSPNGQYLAFVNKGVSIYTMQNRQDYQLISHNPENESDRTAISGPLVWDGSSKFIYTLVSKVNNNAISSTNMVRIYFDEQLNGAEQTILPVPSDALYAVSSDGSKVLYTKDNQIYKYNVNQKVNSLFKNSAANINKLVWLRDGTIVSNAWYANENLYFTTLPLMSSYQIDFNGDTIVYATNTGLPILLYDLTLNRQRFFKDKQTIQGNILRLYY